MQTVVVVLRRFILIETGKLAKDEEFQLITSKKPDDDDDDDEEEPEKPEAKKKVFRLGFNSETENE